MKKITVAVCVDDNLGMTFLGKRVSRDRILVEEFMEMAKGKRVLASTFSKILFQNYPDVMLCDDPFGEASDGDFCFIENLYLRPHLEDIATLVIYRWNRAYPKDMRLDVSPDADGFKLIEVKEFVGSSHDKITKEVYSK